MSIRRVMMITAAVTVLVCSQLQAAERVETTTDDWKITIAPAGTGLEKENQIVDPTTYKQIYDSIPFNRAEYRANPSYRHDATLELMFGKMRETVIHRNVYQPQQQQQQQPTSVYPNTSQSVLLPYRYNRNLRSYGLGYYFLWNARGLY